MVLPAHLNSMLATFAATSPPHSHSTTEIINDLCNAQNRSSIDARVAALLCVAATDSNLILNSANRIRAIDLMFDQVSNKYDRLLPKTKIQDGQRNVKLDFLVDTFREAERRFCNAFEQYQGVIKLHHFRQSLLRELGSDYIKLAILPLLSPAGDPVDQLRSALSAAVDYTQAEAMQAHAALTTAKEAIAKTLRQLGESRFELVRLIITFLETLSSDLPAHFDASPYGKPASIAISLIRRRYPLHVPGLELGIRLELRNEGQGLATQVEITMTGAIGLRVDPTSRVQLYDVPNGTMLIELPAMTDPSEQADSALCDLRVWWSNVDTSEKERVYHNVTLEHQALGVDLSQVGNPYNLEPVTTQEKLIGRDEMLTRITRTLDTETVGSVYIYGQKRVGKTSLAKVAREIMETRGFAVLFVDVGSVIHYQVVQTVNNLATRLVDEIGTRFYGIPNYSTTITERTSYSLDGSLGLLAHVLEQVALSNWDHRIIIILDEFDGLPIPLLGRNDVADTFFLGLRNISGIDRIGLVLVGGERMQLVMNGPGVNLNRFMHVSVDYLDRTTQWRDFEELVRRPTIGFLEFTDAACARIYEYTDGNPYYTKQLCEQVLHTASERSDVFIDSPEVDSAVENLLSQIGVTSFSHYWEDFLLDEPNNRGRDNSQS